jgi:hypothetical protein
MSSITKCLAAAVAAVVLVGCGGGGGGSGSGVIPVSSANAFNIRAGFQNLVMTGWSKTFNVTGSCTGTTTITFSPASTSTTFEAAPALSGTQVGSYSWTGCTPSSGSSTIVNFYDSNYVALGKNTPGGTYGVYLSPPVVPTAARVGDVSVMGTLTLYTDSTKATPAGRIDSTLVMEADTATTAIANVISSAYNASGVLTSTEQNRYRVAADNALTSISFDFQNANGSTLRIFGN